MWGTLADPVKWTCTDPDLSSWDWSLPNPGLLAVLGRQHCGGEPLEEEEFQPSQGSCALHHDFMGNMALGR